MPNDTTGVRYRSLISNANSKAAVNTDLTRGLQSLAKYLHSGGTTESTSAVGYWGGKLYVAKLHATNPPRDYLDRLADLIYERNNDDDSMDNHQDLQSAINLFGDNGTYKAEEIIGVGGGRTGLHAEMMLILEYSNANVVSAWNAQTLTGVYIAASQGACPGCGGFMNLKGISHTGIRSTGRCSSRWVNPFDNTICGTEVGMALSFPNISVKASAQWIG